MRIDSIKFDRDEYDCFERIKIGSENRPMAPGPETQLDVYTTKTLGLLDLISILRKATTSNRPSDTPIVLDRHSGRLILNFFN